MLLKKNKLYKILITLIYLFNISIGRKKALYLCVCVAVDDINSCCSCISIILGFLYSQVYSRDMYCRDICYSFCITRYVRLLGFLYSQVYSRDMYYRDTLRTALVYTLKYSVFYKWCNMVEESIGNMYDNF